MDIFVNQRLHKRNAVSETVPTSHCTYPILYRDYYTKIEGCVEADSIGPHRVNLEPVKGKKEDFTALMAVKNNAPILMTILPDKGLQEIGALNEDLGSRFRKDIVDLTGYGSILRSVS